MQQIRAFAIFHWKIIPLLTILSSSMAGLGMMASGSFTVAFATSYLFLTPLLLYLIYELRNPNEYLYYYNIGLTRVILWTSSMFTNLIISIIIFSLYE